MDHKMRVLKLKRVLDIQQEIFDLTLEWSDIWHLNGTQPNYNKVPDLLTLLAEAIAIIEKQVNVESTHTEFVIGATPATFH